MYSGPRGLGYPQYAEADDTDLQAITMNFYSPPFGYPAQRIMEYDTPLAEHQTLNGVGVARIPTRQRLWSYFSPLFRTQAHPSVPGTDVRVNNPLRASMKTIRAAMSHRPARLYGM